MHYEGNIIRPPSEAHSIVLQVTVGCSHNKCTFCGAYKDTIFRIKEGSITLDLDFASLYCRRQNRVFLADGDALIIPQRRLLCILSDIRHKLPWVNRISLYANGKAIRSKSSEELKQLKAHGIDRIYMGLESGSDTILAKIQKGESSQSMIDAALKIRRAGFFLSVTILLGIGGIIHSAEHARSTAWVLNNMSPNQIAALTLMPLPSTPLGNDYLNGEFMLPGSMGILHELRTIIEYITIDHVQFYANHASNYLELSGRLQKDTDKFIRRIEDALQGSIPLVEDYRRAL